MLLLAAINQFLSAEPRYHSQNPLRAPLFNQWKLPYQEKAICCPTHLVNILPRFLLIILPFKSPGILILNLKNNMMQKMY